MFGLKKVSRKVIMTLNPPTVEEIHEAFDTAGEKALKEAKSLLEKLGNQQESERLELLRKIGFVSAAPLAMYENNKVIKAATESRAAILEKYMLKYPQYKFIFIEQVEELCKKYGLLCAPIRMYKGDVPLKNLKEMEAFKVKDEDIYLTNSRGYVDRLEFDFKRGDFISRQYFEGRKQQEKLQQGEYVNRMNAMYGYGTSMPYTNGNYLEVPKFICAPKDDILIPEGYKVEGVFAGRELKDPIVLHYVKDGFLIETKWGVEGDDPMLTNEKMN